MGCKIIFSPQAIADLEAAVRFIAVDNPEAAIRVGNGLIDRAAILQNFPLVGSAYPKRPGVRKLVSQPYLIFYRFRETESVVDILRYWHGSRGEPEL
ncbi:MAG TPA: type II toxin-antitoxin system RelE/ParE family toxin [Verrucomicrobiae bacterium]|nr:type II toxin-antitoxin system RelE/ParE family toxin [Verrucomicrobiae bacterium]